ncbi:MAG TPA: glutamate carboxypeptidase [Steroidobacteraceae bacterium]|nr:glutamate carboxypeptidase [Steroidobacteraceae bacterium]
MLQAVLASIFPALAGAAPHPNAKVLEAVKACEPSGRELLERAVAIDSGTGDAEGLNAVGALYSAELQALGAQVKSVAPKAPAVGNNVVASLTGTGKGRIVLIAHMDTVFNHGDVARRVPHWQGQHYIGPGAGDDKAGGVTAVCALKVLRGIRFSDFARIDVLLNSNEETGSFGTRDLIRSLALASDLVINLERGIPTDQVLKARKGSATLTVQFTGRAAHSGLEPEKGRNAVIEAAKFALALEKLSNPERKTTVTVDVLTGGDKTNVVPAHAELKADVRAFTNEELDRVEQAVAKLASHPSIDGVTIKTSMQRSFPPWPSNQHTDHVIERANRLYAEIGREITATAVGSSADVSYAAQTGTPSVDGFGIEGGGAHSVDDYADIGTLVPRVYLLARLLMDVGHDPKGL